MSVLCLTTTQNLSCLPWLLWCQFDYFEQKKDGFDGWKFTRNYFHVYHLLNVEIHSTCCPLSFPTVLVYRLLNGFAQYCDTIICCNSTFSFCNAVLLHCTPGLTLSARCLCLAFVPGARIQLISRVNVWYASGWWWIVVRHLWSI